MDASCTASEPKAWPNAAGSVACKQQSYLGVEILQSQHVLLMPQLVSKHAGTIQCECGKMPSCLHICRSTITVDQIVNSVVDFGHLQT